MERFVDIARLHDIPPAAGLAVEVAGQRVALFHVDGDVFAIDSGCVRCGGNLAAGTLEGHEVECPQCGWRYDVVTGRTRGVPNLRLDTFKIRISVTTVMIQMEDGFPSLPVRLTSEGRPASPLISPAPPPSHRLLT